MRSKRDTSHLQSPEVTRKRVIGIRRAAKARRKLKQIGFIPTGGGHQLSSISSDSRFSITNESNVAIAKRLIQLALELL